MVAASLKKKLLLLHMQLLLLPLQPLCLLLLLPLLLPLLPLLLPLPVPRAVAVVSVQATPSLLLPLL